MLDCKDIAGFLADLIGFWTREVLTTLVLFRVLFRVMIRVMRSVEKYMSRRRQLRTLSVPDSLAKLNIARCAVTLLDFTGMLRLRPNTYISLQKLSFVIVPVK